MPHVICEPCIGVKDRSCQEVCPVECIYDAGEQLYIHPDEVAVGKNIPVLQEEPSALEVHRPRPGEKHPPPPHQAPQSMHSSGWM